MLVSNLRPIYRVRLVVTTCSAQLISHCLNTKVAPISIKEVHKMRFSLHVGPTSCYYKSHGVNWPLTDLYWFGLVCLSPALVNDYWTVINTTVTEGSKHFLLGRGGGTMSTHNKWGCAILTRKVVRKI